MYIMVIKVDIEEVIKESRENHKFFYDDKFCVYDDFAGLAQKAFPFMPIDDGVRKVVSYFCEKMVVSEYLSFDFGNDKSLIMIQFNGRECYSTQFLLGFKQFERDLASKYHVGSNELNWYKMQDDLAAKIREFS